MKFIVLFCAILGFSAAANIYVMRVGDLQEGNQDAMEQMADEEGYEEEVAETPIDNNGQSQDAHHTENVHHDSEKDVENAQVEPINDEGNEELQQENEGTSEHPLLENEDASVNQESEQEESGHEDVDQQQENVTEGDNLEAEHRDEHENGEEREQQPVEAEEHHQPEHVAENGHKQPVEAEEHPAVLGGEEHGEPAAQDEPQAVEDEAQPQQDDAQPQQDEAQVGLHPEPLHGNGHAPVEHEDGRGTHDKEAEEGNKVNSAAFASARSYSSGPKSAARSQAQAFTGNLQ